MYACSVAVVYRGGEVDGKACPTHYDQRVTMAQSIILISHQPFRFYLPTIMFSRCCPYGGFLIATTISVTLFATIFTWVMAIGWYDTSLSVNAGLRLARVLSVPVILASLFMSTSVIILSRITMPAIRLPIQMAARLSRKRQALQTFKRLSNPSVADLCWAAD